MSKFQEYLAAALAIHAAAVAIVNLTPTPKDDEALSRIYRAIELLAGIIGPNCKR